MTCLHITIEKQEDGSFRIQSNNLRREDARPDEIEYTNRLEAAIGSVVVATAGQVLHYKMDQQGPGASK